MSLIKTLSAQQLERWFVSKLFFPRNISLNLILEYDTHTKFDKINLSLCAST
jgi:hypothetical protein